MANVNQGGQSTLAAALFKASCIIATDELICTISVICIYMHMVMMPLNALWYSEKIKYNKICKIHYTFLTYYSSHLWHNKYNS